MHLKIILFEIYFSFALHSEYSLSVWTGAEGSRNSLGRRFIADFRPHQVIPSRAKAEKLTRFLILLLSRTEPQPNSHGENLNLRYNLAKRSVKLLLREPDEI